MRDGRSPRERARCRDPAGKIAQDPAAQRCGEGRVHPPERGRRYVLERRWIVWVVAEPAGQSRVVESERDAKQRRATRDGSLDVQREPPGRLAGRLQQRVGAGRSPYRRCVAAGEKCGRPTVQHGLGGGHDDDQVGLQDRRVHTGARAVGEVEGREVGVRGVVHEHATSIVACLRRRQEPLEVSARKLPREPASHEDRLPLVVCPAPGQLLENGGECHLPRIDLRPRYR